MNPEGKRKIMMKQPMKHWRLALIPAATALLMACASTPASNPALDQARTVYAQASADAFTARSAPMDLRRAQDALMRAEEALKAGDDTANVVHYAYLARQRATTALQSGEVARAELAVTDAAKERDRILLDARTRSAEVSAAAAAQANANAQQQQADAERARQEALAAAAQADQARQNAEMQLAAAQAAQAKAAQLQQQLSDLQAQQTDRGMVLTLGDVLFDTGRAVLKSGAMVTIDRLAAFMRNNPERTLMVEGHTDSVGSDAFNRGLSQQRADAVKTALTLRNIDDSRIKTEGLGKARPVASNDTAEGRQRNRRVEIVISNPK